MQSYYTKYFIEKWYEHLADNEKHICLVDDEKIYTRCDIEILSGKVYSYLKDNDIGKEDVVLINVKRSALIFAIMLGIAKVGACFVVTENEAKDRIEHIKRDCNCKLVIDDDVLLSINEYTYIKGYIDVNDNDAAYIVYTSGTTGFPKGVLHEYGSYKRIYDTDASDGRQKTDEDTKFAFVSYFDNMPTIMVFTIFIYSGGEVYVVDYDTIKNPDKIILYFEKNKITHTFLPPIMVKYIGKNINKDMKNLYTGSDDASDISISHGKLCNCYLMSEAGCFLTQYFIERPMSICPVGKPKDGIELKINDDGELLYKYRYCRGYINNSKLTKETFVNGWYHTSDIVYIDDNGDYVIKGRKSDMFKVSGHRIEPLDIEKNVKDILHSDVLVKCFEKNNKKSIALYYIDKNIDKNDLMKKLENKLPSYMWPNIFIYIDRIPYTDNGKIDRESLRFEEKESVYVSPSTDIEKKICRAVEKILDIDNVGLDDDIFSLGINSIDIIKILQELNINDLKEKHFYAGCTVKGIVDIFISDNIADEKTLLEKEQEGRKHIYYLSYTGKTLYDVEKKINHNNPLLYIKKAFKLSKIINLEKLRDVINKYMYLSSTFQVELGYDEKNQPYYRYNPSLYKKIDIEELKESDIAYTLEHLYQDIQPLKGKPYSIRLIKTEEYIYFTFCIHHIFADADGVALIFKDILNMYINDDYQCHNHFFAWLYDNEKEKASIKNIEYKNILKEYFDNIKWDCNICDNKRNNTLYKEKSFCIDVSLSDLNDYIRKNALNRGALLSAAIILTESIITCKKNVIHPLLYADRNNNINHAGLTMKMLYMGICIDKYETLCEYIDDVNKKYKNILYHSSVYDFVDKKYIFSNMLLDDMNNVDEIPREYNKLIQEIPTFVSSDYNYNIPVSIKPNYFFNIDNMLYSAIYYDEYEMSAERANEYISKLKMVFDKIMHNDEKWFQHILEVQQHED